MSQSRRMSLVEAAVNVVVGYGLALATQIVAFPWFGLHPSLGENLAIGVIFVVCSLLRSYTLRRLFEALRPCQDRTRNRGTTSTYPCATAKVNHPGGSRRHGRIIVAP